MILAGDKRLAIFENLRESIPIHELLSAFNNFDLVFLEGYFQNEFPKIEVHRKENVIAFCFDKGKVEAPLFSFEELDQLAQFIERLMLKKEGVAVS